VRPAKPAEALNLRSDSPGGGFSFPSARAQFLSFDSSGSRTRRRRDRLHFPPNRDRFAARRSSHYIASVPPRRISSLLDDPPHAGLLDGASLTAHAELGGIVRIGLWLDGEGRVTRARFRATSCPALVAYAEAACALAEGERLRRAPTAEELRAAVAGVHPVHRDRAGAVALAFERALSTTSFPPAEEQERA
jgi:hypothetical protein